PWEHVLGMGLGAVFLQVDLDKMLDKAKAANERRYFVSYSEKDADLSVRFFL
ncbi:hypothetical protein MKX01_031884, partial [Papaver californicum]